MRIVVAEDLTLLPDGLIRMLEAYGFEVVAAVGGGPDLLTELVGPSSMCGCRPPIPMKACARPSRREARYPSFRSWCFLNTWSACTPVSSSPTATAGSATCSRNPATETAAYFAVAECLSNIVKHSGATTAEVVFADRPSALLITVTDDGEGGADLLSGSGLRGIADRLDAVDARLDVDSPAGGPTRIAIRIPI